MTLRICAFNIQNFGDTKLSDEDTSEVIVKVSLGRSMISDTVTQM